MLFEGRADFGGALLLAVKDHSGYSALLGCAPSQNAAALLYDPAGALVRKNAHKPKRSSSLRLESLESFVYVHNEPVLSKGGGSEERIRFDP